MGHIKSFFGTIQRRPLKVVAGGLAVGGLINLLFAPLSSDGDSWIGRLTVGAQAAKSSGNPLDILAQDSAGNNAVSILGLQVVQNIGSSIPMFVGAAIAAWASRRFKA